MPSSSSTVPGFVARSKAFSERLAQARKYHVGMSLPTVPRPAARGPSPCGLRRGSQQGVLRHVVRGLRVCVRHVEPQLREGTSPPCHLPAAVRLCVDGGLAPACTIRTRPAPRQTRPGPRWCGPRHELASPTGAGPHPPRRRSRAASHRRIDSAAVAAQTGGTAQVNGGQPRRRRIQLTPLDWTGRQMSAPLRRRQRWRRSSRSSR